VYQEQLQKADAHFTRDIAATSPDRLAYAYFERGKTRLAKGDYGQAIKDLKEVVRLEPGFAPAYAALGGGYARNRQAYEALVARGRSEYYDNRGEVSVATFTEAIQMDSRRADAWLGRGKAYFGQGKTEYALADLTTAIKLDRNLADALMERGKVSRSLGKKDLALADFNAALKVEPDHIEALFARGAFLSEEGQWDESLSDLDRALQKHPAHLNALAWRAQIYVQKGRYDQALNEAEQILRIAPQNPYPYLIRAMVAVQRNQHAEAVQNLEQGVRLSAVYSKTALRLYDRIIHDRPDLGPAYHGRGIAYYQVGRFQEAIADLTQALTMTIDVPQTKYDRGMAYVRLWKYPEAIDDLEQAFHQKQQFKTTTLSNEQLARIGKESEPQPGGSDKIGGFRQPDAYKNLAWAYYQTGRYDRAGELLGEVTRRDSTDDEAWFFLGLMNVKLGRLQAAVICLSNAERLVPTNSTYKTTHQAVAQKYKKHRDEVLSAQFSDLIFGGVAIIIAGEVADEARCNATPGCQEERLKKRLDDLQRGIANPPSLIEAILGF
jgi:tetratricopeptide (TPR) repeat protein